MEEIIHYNQKKMYGESNFLKNRFKYEIEAQDELLKIGEAEGWSTSEMNRIRAAKAEYQKRLKEESIETGNE